MSFKAQKFVLIFLLTSLVLPCNQQTISKSEVQMAGNIASALEKSKDFMTKLDAYFKITVQAQNAANAANTATQVANSIQQASGFTKTFTGLLSFATTISPLAGAVSIGLSVMASFMSGGQDDALAQILAQLT